MDQAVDVLAVGPAFELDPLLRDGVRVRVDGCEAAAEAIGHLAAERYALVLVNHTVEGDLSDEQLA